MKINNLEDLARQVSAELVDRGLVIEAGWVMLRSVVVSRDASDAQLFDMRMAFFAGAQHLFGSIMSFLDPGEDPTEQDLRRMDLIGRELGKFADELRLHMRQSKGNA